MSGVLKYLPKIFRRFIPYPLLQHFRMTPPDVAVRLEQRASAAEEIIAHLKKEVQELQKSMQERSYQVEMQKLKEENAALKQEMDEWKQRLAEAEIKNGVKQIAVPVQSAKNTLTAETAAPDTTEPEPKAKPIQEKEKKGENKVKEKGTGKKEETELSIDVGRLDFRVGKIISARKHPDADSLYIEEVDIGEEKTRTVVSGLVKFVELDEMQNKMAILLCNLKPVKMRGVTSEAMVMCASTSEKVEILIPPEGGVPGDIVEFEGYRRCPDTVLNSKKKIFETCAPDLKTDERKVASYKGVPFTVPSKGVVVAPSLANVQIK